MSGISWRKLAEGQLEEAQGTAFMCWCAMQFPHCPDLQYMFHVPNGGLRGDDPKSNAIRGAKLKAQGVKPGVPDYCLPVVRRIGLIWYAGLWIEMKKPRGGKLNDSDQLRWSAHLKSQGYYHSLSRTAQLAIDVVKHYYSEDNLPWRDDL